MNDEKQQEQQEPAPAPAPKLKVQVLRDADSAAFGDSVRHVLRLVAEEEGEHPEAVPLDISIVVDMSASMGGVFSTLRRAILFIFETLSKSTRQGSIRVSLVGFSDEATVLIPMAPLEADGNWRETIVRLQPFGNTDLFAGIQAAMDDMETQESDYTRSRVVVLLSDGFPNRGVTVPEEIKAEFQQHPLFGKISLFSITIGDHCDFGLLHDLAKSTLEGTSFEISACGDFSSAMGALIGIALYHRWQDIQVNLKSQDSKDDGFMQYDVSKLAIGETRSFPFTLDVGAGPMIAQVAAECHINGRPPQYVFANVEYAVDTIAVHIAFERVRTAEVVELAMEYRGSIGPGQETALGVIREHSAHLGRLQSSLDTPCAAITTMQRRLHALIDSFEFSLAPDENEARLARCCSMEMRYQRSTSYENVDSSQELEGLNIPRAARQLSQQVSDYSQEPTFCSDSQENLEQDFCMASQDTDEDDEHTDNVAPLTQASFPLRRSSAMGTHELNDMIARH